MYTQGWHLLPGIERYPGRGSRPPWGNHNIYSSGNHISQAQTPTDSHWPGPGVGHWCCTCCRRVGWTSLNKAREHLMSGSKFFPQYVGLEKERGGQQVLGLHQQVMLRAHSVLILTASSTLTTWTGTEPMGQAMLLPETTAEEGEEVSWEDVPHRNPHSAITCQTIQTARRKATTTRETNL